MSCAAYGCPMPGVYRGFGMGEGWWCFIHGSGACDLQATTLRINAASHPLKVAIKASNMSAQQWADASNQRYVADVMARHGYAELTPTAEERGACAQSWAARARAALRSACLVRDKDDLVQAAERSGQSAFQKRSTGEFFSGFSALSGE